MNDPYVKKAKIENYRYVLEMQNTYSFKSRSLFALHFTSHSKDWFTQPKTWSVAGNTVPGLTVCLNTNIIHTESSMGPEILS